MKLHELKIEKQYYDDIVDGRKTFEVRKNDRDFQEGDIVVFKLPNGMIKNPVTYVTNITYNDNPTDKVFKITYLLKNIDYYGLDKDYCIFGIKELK